MAWLRRSDRLSSDQLDRLPELLGDLDRFDDVQRERHATLTARLFHRLDWTPARGMDLTDQMRLRIAAHAAVLGAGMPDDVLANVGSVVVHAGAIIDRQPRPTPMRGVITEEPRALSGHTTAHGPVFISWPAVRRSSRGNVVLHEFAHKLDAANHVFDGTPSMVDRGLLERWIEVCTRVYHGLHGSIDPVLRPYAATNPAEFFAVATEVFFVRPLELRGQHPDLYDVFATHFGQDPAAIDELRQPATDDAALGP